MKTRILQALGAVAVGFVAIAPPAEATVVDGGHYSSAYDSTYDDCGFDVVVQGAATGNFRIRQGKGAADTAFFAHDNFSFTETHTNPTTGGFFTITGNGNFNEVKATRVQGTIFEFRSIEAANIALYDANGNLVLRDRGSVHVRQLFDTEGDNVPGGVHLEILGVEVHGPHPSFDGGFCDIITLLIG